MHTSYVCVESLKGFEFFKQVYESKCRLMLNGWSLYIFFIKDCGERQTPWEAAVFRIWGS